jgi:predicted cupin superfamily sugar epimerase
MGCEAKKYIDKLRLEPHPEGGYYREIYRSDELILPPGLPERFKKGRAISTSIYFLLEGEQISNFHRLKSDEIWHFYDGCGVIIFTINTEGKLSEFRLGNNLDQKESLQVVIKHGNWFAAELPDKNSYCLAGCTVSPGFDFEDFEMGDRDTLLKDFPNYTELIRKFTKS